MGGPFSSSNPKLNPYRPGKSVLHTISGCGLGCSGGGVAKVDGKVGEWSRGSCLKPDCCGFGKFCSCKS